MSGNRTIECTVNNCKYYQKGDICTASSIRVEKARENMMECADCRTFSPVDESCGGCGGCRSCK